MMSCTQANAFLPNVKLGVRHRRREKCEAFQKFLCSPSKYRNFDPICLAKRGSSSQNEGFLRLVAGPLKNRTFNAICSAKGGSKSENEVQGFSWESLKNAIGGMKKEESVQDWLKKQMRENDFDGDGGDGGRPGGGGGGDGSGGEEDEGFAGFMDELLQVIMATIGFVFVYIYLIRGAELTRLARDYIKYLFGRGASVRLRRAMVKWERFCEKFIRREEVREDWLERAIIATPTWWHNPRKLADMMRYRGDDD